MNILLINRWQRLAPKIATSAPAIQPFLLNALITLPRNYRVVTSHTSGSISFPPAPTYPNLMTHLQSVTKWKMMAAHLLKDVGGYKTDQIEKSCHGDVEECRIKMIREYLKGGDIS